MTLHRFNGDEIYSVQSATINQNQTENGLFAITFVGKAAWPPIKMLADTESSYGKPTIGVTVHVDKSAALILKAGATFAPSKGDD